MSADKRPSVVLPHALPLPIFKRLQHRRVVLASSSPRRKDILETAVRPGVSYVRSVLLIPYKGLRPEIIPSTFAEDLPKVTFQGRLADYPIATAGEKVRPTSLPG